MQAFEPGWIKCNTTSRRLLEIGAARETRTAPSRRHQVEEEALLDVTPHSDYHDGRSGRDNSGERSATFVGIREMTTLSARNGHAKSSVKQRRSFFGGTIRSADEINRPTLPARSNEDGWRDGIPVEGCAPKRATAEVAGNESEKDPVGEDVVEPRKTVEKVAAAT